VFERFTDRARQVVVEAQAEARRLRHNYIGSEHILLGLLHVEEGVAGRILLPLGVTVEDVRADVVRVVGEGPAVTTGQIPFTPDGKKLFELALREAQAVGDQHIGTEHLLLALVSVEKGVVPKILEQRGLVPETIRGKVTEALAGPRDPPFPPAPRKPLPPMPPELAAEIEQVREEKESAIDAHDFERAAMLRDEERRLHAVARGETFHPSFSGAHILTTRGVARFTERARQIFVLAHDEARELKHDYIGTEHLLLGLLREKEGLAARVLDSFDMTAEEVRAQIVRIIGRGEQLAIGPIQFTPRGNRVLEFSLREALALGHNYIGTEHILLGILREDEGVATRIMLDFGADAENVRNEVIQMIGGHGLRQALSKAAGPSSSARCRA
jgi:ATP-dependent Clp protease ATP-binding subunit ClpA